MQKADGRWTTTGEACNWPRCLRCRRPVEESPFGSGLCDICYFYKTISVEEFWRLHNEDYPLAPYNIGRRCTANLMDRRPLEDPKVNWRQYLRDAQPTAMPDLSKWRPPESDFARRLQVFLKTNP